MRDVGMTVMCLSKQKDQLTLWYWISFQAKRWRNLTVDGEVVEQRKRSSYILK